MVDWDGLENRCAFTGTVGSNPTLSATYLRAGAFGGHKESDMTTKSKPGNQPDPGDMSGMSEGEGKAHQPAPAHPDVEQEEEEAARLGDFA